MTVPETHSRAVQEYLVQKNNTQLTQLRHGLFEIFDAFEGNSGTEGELKTAAARLINFLSVEVDVRISDQVKIRLDMPRTPK